MVKISRRGFLMGCSAAIAAMAGSRITNLAFAAPNAASEAPGALVVVFLRGGWDALNVVPVIGGPDRGFYEAARYNIKIPTSGAGAAFNLNGQFGLHPSMGSLYEMYQSKKLAIVHATGLTSDTRSHFDAQQYIELGTPGAKSSSTGWITRHLQSSPYGSSGIFPALSTGGGQAMSLAGFENAVAMNDPSSFNLDGWENYVANQRTALRTFYAGAGFLDAAARETLDTIDLIESTAPGDYVPANGATYPQNSFGDNLQSIAQLIKMNLGLNVATVDLGGWDTHEHQGNTPGANDQNGGYLGTQLKPLADALKAFMLDLDGSCPNWANRTTVVVMSEFGRRVAQNSNDGTDHGHGSAMLVLGGSGIKGGAVYGAWPGLATAQLYDRADLAVTTDYRQVLSEIVQNQLGNPNVATVFPGFTPGAPLGLATTTGGGGTPPAFPANLTQRLFVPIVRKGAGC